MSKPRILKGKVTFVSLLTIAFLLCFITTVQAFPQLSLPKNELKFGVREIVPPVKEFCEVFGITLSKKLNDSDQPITVQYIPIENEYKGKNFSRFQGLLDKKVQVECGPNSITSEELVNPSKSNTAKRPFSDWIDFSNPFYDTDVSLLLKSDLALELAALPSNQLNEKLQNLKIGILEGTTTQKQFQGRTLYQGIVTFETKGPDTNDPLKGISSLEQALNALDKGDITALASDGIILQSFLKDGIKGTENNDQDTVRYRESRPAYSQRNPPFSIFPASGSLPELLRERYGIAVSSDPIESELIKAINMTLNDLNDQNSPLTRAQKNLRLYEDGKPISSWESIISQAQNGNIYVQPPEPTPEIFSNPAFWVVLVFASIVILALLKYWDRFYAEIASVFGSLRVGGEHKSASREVAISAREMTSKEGGFNAEDETGQGMNLSKIHARDDINLNVRSEQKNPPGVDAQTLTAGRDITIQQFIQDFGVSKPKISNSHQFPQYFELWTSLLELQFIGHELWDFRDEANLIQFADQLRDTRRLVHQQQLGILFKDSDRQQLFSVLQNFGEIRVGSRILREIRSNEDVRQFLSETIITNNRVPRSEMIRRIVSDNEEYKFDYEQVVERIRVSFRERLSGKAGDI